MNFVIDASVTLNWLLRDGTPPNSAYAIKVLKFLTREDTLAIAPATWWLEIANVVVRAESKRLINQAQAETFLEMLDNLGTIEDKATTAKALSDTLRLARQYRLSSYDASYLELALRTGLPLSTLDDDLRKAAKKAGVERYLET